MEDSYETFEEELGPRRTDPPHLLKPLRQIRRPEMYATRKFREELAPAAHQIRAETKSFTRNPEQSLPKMTSLHKPSSTQNLTQVEVPWENVTLNRCLFVAITLLVITSGFQRLHETLRGRVTVEEREEMELMLRKTSSIRHRGAPEPETSLWEVMFWWLPDLNDEDEGKTRKSKKRATGRRSSGLRNKPLLDKELLKERDEKFKDRRERKGTGEENKDKKERENNQDIKKGDGERVEDECNGKIGQKKKKIVEENKET
ncbi:uncharacterized protein LOC103395946 [Cynoglossus semilaevis]|uniref:uncharacterized protein LOC103395946 n=1 Tax=Cynoglossus semilaevis TaxID=244447 RepID=UPI000497BBEF|nr:uncharacterized protein LOC103395946 [Cynoglossus semilaevis]XP_024922079.1 uncharacterized protein LOC103395946 [Cynoglossus semilaevis]